MQFWQFGLVTTPCGIKPQIHVNLCCNGQKYYTYSCTGNTSTNKRTRVTTLVVTLRVTTIKGKGIQSHLEVVLQLKQQFHFSDWHSIIFTPSTIWLSLCSPSQQRQKFKEICAEAWQPFWQCHECGGGRQDNGKQQTGGDNLTGTNVGVREEDS